MDPDSRETLGTIAALKRSWPVITTCIGLASGGYAYLDNRFSAQAADTRSIVAALEQQTRDRGRFEASALERMCVDERELLAEASARVSLAAATAEPDKRKRESAAAAAVKRFEAAAADWPCPSTDERREGRVDRPLWKRADSAIR